MQLAIDVLHALTEDVLWTVFCIGMAIVIYKSSAHAVDIVAKAEQKRKEESDG